MLSLYFLELTGKIEEHWRKNIDDYDYMLDKVFDKIKELIGNKKFDDTKKLIETDSKLLDHIAF